MLESTDHLFEDRENDTLQDQNLGVEKFAGGKLTLLSFPIAFEVRNIDTYRRGLVLSAPCAAGRNVQHEAGEIKC